MQNWLKGIQHLQVSIKSRHQNSDSKNNLDPSMKNLLFLHCFTDFFQKPGLEKQATMEPFELCIVIQSPKCFRS